MVTHLNEDEQAGFSFAVQLYTKLLFEQKELLNGIIEVAYAQGIQEGIVYAQQVVSAQEQEQQSEEPINPFGEEKYLSDIPKPPQPQRPVEPRQQPQRSPAEELISKMKGVKR